MDQHPIPRQITTFEFKLIGSLTLKQFGYLAIFLSAATIMYYLVPIPFLNITLALLVALFGISLAFIPINERPLDVFIKNFLKRILSPTQYYYMKNNSPPAFITNLPPLEKKVADGPITSKTNLESQIIPEKGGSPFLSGFVKDRKDASLPNILVYVKDTNNQLVRLLKTDTNGSFSSFQPLSPAKYFFEIKDPGGKHIFDKMEIGLSDHPDNSLVFYSKKIL